MATLRVLLVEDNEDDELLISRSLSKGGIESELNRVATAGELTAALKARDWDVILASDSLPDLPIADVLRIVQEYEFDIPLIALCGDASEEHVMALLRAGVRDYVTKERTGRLPGSVEREMRVAEARRQTRRLETQLQQSSKMEAIGRLAGGVAHDFNNLLTVITGFAQLSLLDETPSRAGLEQIILAAERATGLTRQLLAFSRQQALEPRVFDLNQLVRDMEKMLSRLIGEDIQVVTRYTRERLTVRADPSQMEQVVLNLAVNARDAMPRGGRLMLNTGSRLMQGSSGNIHGLADGDYCVISVSDTGAGIPPDVLPHIFEPFFTTKPAGQGTGLGLATVYGILRQSGGAITAYSEKDIGTTMTVFLPASEGTYFEEAVQHASSLDAGSEKILVAEDDPDVRKFVCEALALRGFDVRSAASGEVALKMLQSAGTHGIDLLITDVVMPGMSGPALAESAVQFAPDLRLLFMSGYTEDVIQHHGFSSGAAAFLQKPFAPRDLLQKVRKLLDVTVP